ncbi:CPBP family intramembrane metalloprotease [Paenibacillus donghaensis]|uniref:CPBP family intramembrane glutamic endopeptidase n=1 Tax=Paenibacillus donghaensis TaxID=414771 RepID=UPI0018838A10|nr:type II CAAX endopeptidase family protein [Paenibacillus donghaensis]MBE9915317.1 CPBP family intramembrane metalloprotease [Paenibacillus donghaensis]
MNPVGQPLQLKVNYKRLGVFAVIGLVLFVLFQILPSTASETLEQQNTKVISKEQALSAAETFAQDTLHLQIDKNKDAVITYQSSSDLFGYLSREKLLEKYNKTYEKNYPYDVFRVRLATQGENSSASVDVHMNSSKVVAFSVTPRYSKYAAAMAEPNKELRESKLKIVEGDLSLQDKQQLAEPWLQQMGYNAGKLEVSTGRSGTGLVYTDPAQSIGSSMLQIKFTFEDGAIHSFQPAFSVPESHMAYVSQQTSLAKWLTMLGYGLLTFVLGVLAIVYSALTRHHTSFKRGIFLSVFYFAVATFSSYNLLPVYKAEGLSGFGLSLALVFQTFFNMVMAALLYFSLVGGDGLWRKRGLNAWARAKEPGYGSYVLHSMFTGYLWAFILMGVQSVIYIVLDKSIHSWSTTDATQSPYNMLYPWLLPIMAWMAGISEEAVYRLFGIPMMKKLVKNTFLACLIPTLIWAFGHTLYPIFPVYTRPIELTVIGLLFSFIFLKHGYIAAMFSHVVFDSVLMSFSLFALGDVPDILAGIVTIVMPAIVGYVVYLYNRKKYPTETKKEPYVMTPHPEGLQ